MRRSKKRSRGPTGENAIQRRTRKDRELSVKRCRTFAAGLAGLVRLAPLVAALLLLSCSGDGVNDIPQGAHWKASAFPVPVRIDGTIDDCRTEHLLEAIVLLNEDFGPVLEPEMVGTVSAAHLVSRPGHIHVQETALVFDFTGNVLGRAVVLMLPKSKRLVSALVRLKPVDCSNYDVTIMRHELAHTLGLPHNDCANYVMRPYVPRGPAVFTAAEVAYLAAQLAGEPLDAPDFSGEESMGDALRISVDF